MAAVEDLPRLAQRHEAVARAPRAVAGRAEARHIAKLQEPAHHLVQRPRVVHVELRGIVLRALLRLVAADAGGGRAGDLRDAEVEDAFPAFFGFARRDNHARVGNGDADDRHELREGVVAHCVGERAGVDVVRRTDARHADGVRPDAVHGLQVLGVHQ